MLNDDSRWHYGHRMVAACRLASSFPSSVPSWWPPRQDVCNGLMGNLSSDYVPVGPSAGFDRSVSRWDDNGMNRFHTGGCQQFVLKQALSTFARPARQAGCVCPTSGAAMGVRLSVFSFLMMAGRRIMYRISPIDQLANLLFIYRWPQTWERNVCM